MNRLIVAGLLLTGCWDFDTARENCETVGACHFAPEEDAGGADDAGAEPEPERPGDVCETDAGLLCWEMPAMGLDYSQVAWDGQRLWAGSENGFFSTWDGKRWSGSFVTQSPIVVASSDEGRAFAVGMGFIAVADGRGRTAPPGYPLAAWADRTGRAVVTCDGTKLHLYEDSWNETWTESYLPDQTCLQRVRLVGASRANLWLITSQALFHYTGPRNWAGIDSGVPVFVEGWRDACERDGAVFVVGDATAHLFGETQSYFFNTGATAIGCTNAGFTLARGTQLEQRADLEVPGVPLSLELPFSPRRLISPDGGALFAVGAGFATRAATEAEFSVKDFWPETTVVAMAEAPDGGVYAVGGHGFVARRTPRGWRTISWNPAWTLTDITFDRRGVGYVVGHVGGMASSFELHDDALSPSTRPYRLADGGAAFEIPQTRLETLADGTVIAVGQGGSVARLAPDSPSWELVVPFDSRVSTYRALSVRENLALALNGGLVAISSSGAPTVLMEDAGINSRAVTLRGPADYFVAEGTIVHHFVDGGIMNLDFSSDGFGASELVGEDDTIWMVGSGQLRSWREGQQTVIRGARMGLYVETVLPTGTGVYAGGNGIMRLRRH